MPHGAILLDVSLACKLDAPTSIAFHDHVKVSRRVKKQDKFK